MSQYETNIMRAGIELTSLQVVAAHGPGTPVTQAVVDTGRALIDGGGRGTRETIPDRNAVRYVFTGPPELVRPVIAAFMAFIRSATDKEET